MAAYRAVGEHRHPVAGRPDPSAALRLAALCALRRGDHGAGHRRAAPCALHLEGHGVDRPQAALSAAALERPAGWRQRAAGVHFAVCPAEVASAVAAVRPAVQVAAASAAGEARPAVPAAAALVAVGSASVRPVAAGAAPPVPSAAAAAFSVPAFAAPAFSSLPRSAAVAERAPAPPQAHCLRSSKPSKPDRKVPLASAYCCHALPRVVLLSSRRDVPRISKHK